tara:strand:+ start:2005 stop:2430 length:426 start_codon:yes stop_codon:yes gene_type:complete
MAQGTKIAEKDVLFNSMSAMIAREYVASDTQPVFEGLYRIPVSATGNTDIDVDRNIEVVDAWCAKVGGAGAGGDTVTVQNEGNAITNAMSVNIADTAVVRAGQINDANYQIASGGTLRIAAAGADATVDCVCYVKVLFYTS